VTCIYPDVLLDAETDLVGVERLRSVHVGDRDGDKLETEMHGTPLATAPKSRWAWC
jgi:hypothetical protein